MELNNYDKWPCMEGHRFNKTLPDVNPELHQVQFPKLMGKPCDCGRTIWHEELCGCAIKKWERKLLPNTNY